MGILTNIKVLTDEGKLKDSAIANFINEVIEKAKKRKPAIVVGPAENPILNLNIVDLVSGDTKTVFELYEQNHPGEERVEALLQEFKVKEGESIDDHKDRCPQYHNVYIEGIFANLATTFDVQPIAALKVVGVEDPTQPIVDIIDNIKEQLADFLQPIIDIVGDIKVFITDRIDIVLSKLQELQALISALLAIELTSELIQAAKDAILSLFDALFGFPAVPPLSDLDLAYIDFRAQFEPKIEEAIEFIHSIFPRFELPPLFPILESNGGWLPDFELPIPLPLDLDFLNFDLEGFDIDFPWFDWEGFFLMEVPPGLLAMIAKFFKNLFEAIVGIITSIVTSFQTFVAKLAEGIQDLIEYFIQLIVEPIIEAILDAFPDITSSSQQFSTLLVILDKIIPMVIIAIIGLLIGSGLIAESVAKYFNLV